MTQLYCCAIAVSPDSDLSFTYSVTQPAAPPASAPPIDTVARRPRWIDYAANGLLAAALLLTGLPLAWLFGLGAASLFAGPRQQVPLQEVALRRTNRIITEIYRLPSRWQPSPPLETRIEPVPIPTQPIAPLTAPPAALNARDRQIAEEELAALTQEFATIQKRLFDLESELGQAQSTASVESRLATLEQRLIPAQSAGTSTDSTESTADRAESPAEPPAESKPLHPVRSPLLETTELKITLPSDALFAPGEARLLTTAPELLNSIFRDLAQYPQATVLVSSYTDDRMEPSQSMSLSFQQANALRAYLRGNLPDHRWVTIGHGQQQALTDNSTPQLRQRNRRIEIAIDRR